MANKTDIFDASSANYVAYSKGGSSDSTTGINFSTIDLGNGANDVVVLHSNNQSANVIKISGSFGKNSIVNFHESYICSWIFTIIFVTDCKFCF